MIDLHCHILPGVDDGPATMEDAVALARAHVEAGTSTVVATSHVSWDYQDNGPANLLPAVEALRARLAEEDVPLEVLPGAEIAMTRVDALDNGDLAALKLGGSAWLLIECPFSPSAAAFAPVLDVLQARGHRIVLAHPERCPAFHREPERLSAYVSQGMLTSLTAGAFVGSFGREVEKVAREFLAEGLVHSVASDAHDLRRRPPGIREHLLAAGLDPALTEWLGRDVPAAILGGDRIPMAPVTFPKPSRGGVLGRLRARTGSGR
ncbi:tyrosine-protein phosphatase [Paraconexibacter sp.]|uniref:tyrosine-protein phosphatase n=1 Tax=Paraconexibacter sp. TaxID=2949640 RepID=UPI00356653A3